MPGSQWQILIIVRSGAKKEEEEEEEESGVRWVIMQELKTRCQNNMSSVNLHHNYDSSIGPYNWGNTTQLFDALPSLSWFHLPRTSLLNPPKYAVLEPHISTTSPALVSDRLTWFVEESREPATFLYITLAL